MWDKIQYETGTGPLFLVPTDDNAPGSEDEPDVSQHKLQKPTRSQSQQHLEEQQRIQAEKGLEVARKISMYQQSWEINIKAIRA